MAEVEGSEWSYFGQENTIKVENENIYKCSKTSTSVWSRNMGPKKEGRRHSRANRDEDGEMDSWNIIFGKEGK